MKGKKNIRTNCEKSRTTEIASFENEVIVKISSKVCSEDIRTSYSKWCFLNKKHSGQNSEKKSIVLTKQSCQPVPSNESDKAFPYKREFHRCAGSPSPTGLTKILDNKIIFNNCPSEKYRFKAPLLTLPLNIKGAKPLTCKHLINDPDHKSNIHSTPECKLNYQDKFRTSRQKKYNENDACQYIIFPDWLTNSMIRKKSFPKENINRHNFTSTSCPYSRYKVLGDSKYKYDLSQKTPICSKYKVGFNKNICPFSKRKYKDMNESYKDWDDMNEESISSRPERDWGYQEDESDEKVRYIETSYYGEDWEEDENQAKPVIESGETSESDDRNIQKTSKDYDFEKHGIDHQCLCSLCEIDLYIRKMRALITSYDPFLSPYSPIRDKLLKQKFRKPHRLQNSRKSFKTNLCVCHYKQKLDDEYAKIPFSEISSGKIFSKRYISDRSNAIIKEMEKWKGKYTGRKMFAGNLQTICPFNGRYVKKY